MITEQEARQLLGVMSVIYPNMPISEATIMPTIKLYQRVYADYSYSELENALESYASTNMSGFPPQPAHLIDIINSGKENYLDFSEVYGMIYKACGRASVYAREDFDDFPEIVQRLVGSPNQLREWGMTAYPDMKNLEFHYKALIEQEKHNARVPQSIKQQLEQKQNNLRIEEK